MLHLMCRSLAITLRAVTISTILIILPSCSSQSSRNVSDSQADQTRSRTYTVVKGDTLRSIATRFSLDFKDLAQYNGIAPPYTIFPGQRLRLDKITRRNTASTASATTLRGQNGQKIRSENETKKSKMSSQYASVVSTVKWQWPASGKIIALFQGETGLNKGIDLGGNLGEPVLAAASGQVLYAGSGLSGYGKLLIIKHNEIFLSAYAHNNELLVKEGDFVKVGQKIADMGSSGTDRVKLHFEIRSEGNPVDPLRFLPKRE